MKKLFIAHVGEGMAKPKAYLPARLCGYHRDHGAVWTAFTPTVNDLSSWVRLEAPGKRTCFVYDAGHGFRRNLMKRKPK